ncbi:hypothetical protein AN219_33765, partial [Streptomyces nanshensis]
HGWDDDAPAALRAPQGTAFTRWALVPALSGDAEGTALFVALAALPLTPAGRVPGDETGDETGAETGDETAASEAAPPPLSGSARLLSADAASAVVRWQSDGRVTRLAFAGDAVEVITSDEPVP